MTQPEAEEDVVGASNRGSPPPSQTQDQGPATAEPAAEHPVIAWTRAVFGGIGDTAKQMLDEGRKGAQEAYDDGWRRFDNKTRSRRKEERGKRQE